MGIQFRYIEYGTNFYGHFSSPKEQSKENIYIFIDNRMKENFSKKMLGKLFIEPPTLLTFEEFKERVFFTDRIILKEAKRILAFFKSLPKDLKEELGVTNYYDIIDLANNFFNHYKQLKVYGIDFIESYPNWQKKYLESLKKIKETFDIFIEKYNYLPSDWLEDIEFFNPVWLKNFKKIIFIDIVEFPKIYIEIFKELSKNIELEFTLQMKKGDFDEENFKLKKISFPKKIKDIEIYLFKEKLEEALSLIYMKQIKKGEIFSPVPIKNEFHQIFPGYFGKPQNFTMNDTKLYKFLNIQLNIVSTEEMRLKGAYQLKELLCAFENKVFQKYYNLNNSHFLLLNSISIEGYHYISRAIIEEDWFQKSFPIEFLEKLNSILLDLENILKISNTTELYLYFKEELDLKQFTEEILDNKDIFDKFFEIFGIIKSNENMKIHTDFSEYFTNKTGISLYRLLIQYMKDLAVKSNIKSEQDISLIKDIDFVRYSEERSEVNYFIDITDEFLPSRTTDNLIFTEKQRREFGMITSEEKREIEKYRFLQAIFNGKESIIFTQKNEDKAIEISPFLEELISFYSLDIKNSPISEKDISNILKQEFCTQPLKIEELSDEVFIKTTQDFLEQQLKLGAYDYTLLTQCQLKFYFQKILNLEYIQKFKEQDLNNRILGIIVHNTLEELTKFIWKQVLKEGILELDSETISERVSYAFKKARAKIPLHIDNYCQEIVIPLITKNILKFFKYLKNKYNDISIQRFQSEKSAFKEKPFYKGEIDIYLDGRADLVIESELGHEIIDYKTGNKSSGQLDYYNIILYGDNSKGDKTIFNVWNGKIEKDDKIILTKEILEESIKLFVESKNYNRTEKKSNCMGCSYSNICEIRGEK